MPGSWTCCCPGHVAVPDMPASWTCRCPGNTGVLDMPLSRTFRGPVHAAVLDRLRSKLQALVYDILPSTTAVFSYAIGSRKLSANEQFFVGAQTVVSLLQTTRIKQGVSCIATNKVYTSANKTAIVSIETELFFLPGVDASHVYVRALALGCFHSHIVPEPFGEC